MTTKDALLSFSLFGAAVSEGCAWHDQEEIQRPKQRQWQQGWR